MTVEYSGLGAPFPFNDRQVGAKERTLKKDIERFGDALWKGPPFEVVNSLIIKAGEMIPVKFKLKAANLPFNGDVSYDLLGSLLAHVRSRYAHLGVDVLNIGERVSDTIQNEDFPKSDRQAVPIEVVVANHGARPVEFAEGARPFHLFYVPPSAYISGEELESMVGNEANKPVYIRGEEGTDWQMIKETAPTGEEQAIGIYLRINPKERYWIPPSNVPLRISEEGTFQRSREDVFTYVLKKIDDPQYPMLEDDFWIGKGPFLCLAPNLYMKLDHRAYALNNDSFEKVGMQINSPLLEGGRTRHVVDFEIKGKGHWVRATVVRNGEVAKPG